MEWSFPHKGAKDIQDTMSDEASDSKKILDRWIEGVNGGNLADVQGLYCEEAVLVPTFSREILTTPEGIAAYFVKITDGRQVRVAVREETVVERACGTGTRVIAGIYDWYITEAGEERSFAARFSYVLEPLTQGPISHHHSSLLPE
ncbi:MAG: hypothetical protein CMP28_13385 [Roseibacillus sp.]|nr:hypothetical protein [Roseibacillus sp.]